MNTLHPQLPRFLAAFGALTLLAMASTMPVKSSASALMRAAMIMRSCLAPTAWA